MQGHTQNLNFHVRTNGMGLHQAHIPPMIPTLGRKLQAFLLLCSAPRADEESALPYCCCKLSFGLMHSDLHTTERAEICRDMRVTVILQDRRSVSMPQTLTKEMLLQKSMDLSIKPHAEFTLHCPSSEQGQSRFSHCVAKPEQLVAALLGHSR